MGKRRNIQTKIKRSSKNRLRLTDDSINRQATTNNTVVDKSMMRREMESIERTQVELSEMKNTIFEIRI